MSAVSKQSQSVKTKFECKHESASAVFLAGSFNGWNDSAMPMKRGKEGTWSTALDLAPGRYEYKFVVDGDWCCSPELVLDQAHACVPNTFGTMNFAIEVGAEE